MLRAKGLDLQKLQKIFLIRIRVDDVLFQQYGKTTQ